MIVESWVNDALRGREGCRSRRTIYGVLLSTALSLVAGCSPSPTAPQAGSKAVTEPVAEAVARPELASVYQVGPVVDLRAMVSPQRDAVVGEFRLQDNHLIIPAVRSAQLNLDVDLPEQYELLLEVAKIRGNESLNIGFTVGGHQVVAVIEGWGNKISGLNRVDGRLGEDNETSTRFPVFTDNSSRTIRVIVRRESVLVDVDSAVFIDYRGAPSRLDFDDRFYRRPRLNQLMLGGWETEFRVSKWTLTPFGDEPVRYTNATDSVAENTGAATRAVDDSPEEPAAESRPAVVGQPVSPDLATTTETEHQAARETREDASSQEGAWSRGDDPVERQLVPWNATPDPYPGWDGTAVADMAVTRQFRAVVVPDGPSPFFMVGETLDQTVTWSVYDVRTGKVVGKSCELPAGDNAHPQLCPSGRYMRSYFDQGSGRRVVVHSFVSGEQVYEAASPNRRIDDQERDYLALNHALLQVRAGSNTVELQRVDLRTGSVESSWNLPCSASELTSVALSPGGRYVLAHWGGELTVYDFAGGQIRGRVRVPEDLDFEPAMAFSIDGTELALMGRQSHRRSPMLWCIDWQTGSTSLLANLRAEIQGLDKNYMLGPALEWFPNKELLLYYGRDIIDRRTGKFCYRVRDNLYWQNPRRTLGNRALLGMMQGEERDQLYFRRIPWDLAALDSAIEVIRRGGIAEDVGLPPLTIPDQTAAAVVTPSDQGGSVALSSDSRPEFPASDVALPMRLAQFSESDTELRRIEFADPAAAAAVVHFTLGTDNEKRRRDVVVRYDLKRGKPTGSIPVRKDFRLTAVSPGGALALVGLFNKVDGYSRFDVVDLASKKHVAGWRPFDDETYAEDIASTGQPQARNPMTANWVRFVDDRLVLAANPAGKLVCWQLPECFVQYICNEFGKPLAMSENRRYVVGCLGSRLRLFDAWEGAWVGELVPEESPQSILRAAFAPDNDELVAVLGYQGSRRLVFWKLASGAFSEQFEIPYHTISPAWSEYQHSMHRQIGLNFRRDGYLTADDLYLIDRAGKSVPWIYGIRRGKHVVNEPDSREWFTEYQITNLHGQGQKFEYWLAAVDLPSDEVLAMIRSAPSRRDNRPLGRSTLSSVAEDAQYAELFPANEN